MKHLQIQDFGQVKGGQEARLYVMENDRGMSVAVTDFGANLVQVHVPDSKGNLVDVVLGYGDAKGYEEGDAAIGAVVGRNANRIGGAAFQIQGVTYQLAKNDNDNNLHSGPDVYQKRFWKVEEAKDGSVTFLMHSPDGDQGFPGTLDMRVTYELTEQNSLRITYDGVPDKDTVINMTNHSYFNLNGHASGDVLGHKVLLDADQFTRANAHSIPTGELLDVTDTPMDFRNLRLLGEAIDADYEAVQLGAGYDHNWVLKNDGKFDKVAQAEGDKTKIVMEVYTDLPGVQMYTANFLDQEVGKEGAVYGRRAGVCFETQYFPNAVNQENFISSVCKAGQRYHTMTEFKFI